MNNENNPYIRVIGYYPEDEKDIIRRVKVCISNLLGKDLEGIESSTLRDNRNQLSLYIPKNLNLDQASKLLELVEQVIKESFAPHSIEVSIEIP